MPVSAPVLGSLSARYCVSTQIQRPSRWRLRAMADVAIHAAVEQGSKDLRQAFRVLGMRHGARGAADHFLRLVTEYLAASRRDISALEVEVELEHHVGAVLGQKTVAGLALLEALLRRDALLDVAADGMNRRHLSFAVSERSIGP